jgi:hypothetical protein
VKDVFERAGKMPLGFRLTSSQSLRRITLNEEKNFSSRSDIGLVTISTFVYVFSCRILCNAASAFCGSRKFCYTGIRLMRFDRRLHKNNVALFERNGVLTFLPASSEETKKLCARSSFRTTAES